MGIESTAGPNTDNKTTSPTGDRRAKNNDEYVEPVGDEACITLRRIDFGNEEEMNENTIKYSAVTNEGKRKENTPEKHPPKRIPPLSNQTPKSPDHSEYIRDDIKVRPEGNNCRSRPSTDTRRGDLPKISDPDQEMLRIEENNGLYTAEMTTERVGTIVNLYETMINRTIPVKTEEYSPEDDDKSTREESVGHSWANERLEHDEESEDAMKSMRDKDMEESGTINMDKWNTLDKIDAMEMEEVRPKRTYKYKWDLPRSISEPEYYPIFAETLYDYLRPSYTLTDLPPTARRLRFTTASPFTPRILGDSQGRERVGGERAVLMTNKVTTGKDRSVSKSKLAPDSHLPIRKRSFSVAASDWEKPLSSHADGSGSDAYVAAVNGDDYVSVHANANGDRHVSIGKGDIHVSHPQHKSALDHRDAIIDAGIDALIEAAGLDQPSDMDTFRCSSPISTTDSRSPSPTHNRFSNYVRIDDVSDSDDDMPALFDPEDFTTLPDPTPGLPLPPLTSTDIVLDSKFPSHIPNVADVPGDPSTPILLVSKEFVGLYTSSGQQVGIGNLQVVNGDPVGFCLPVGGPDDVVAAAQAVLGPAMPAHGFRDPESLIELMKDIPYRILTELGADDLKILTEPKALDPRTPPYRSDNDNMSSSSEDGSGDEGDGTLTPVSSYDMITSDSE